MRRKRKLAKWEFDEIIRKNLIASGISEECFGYRTIEKSWVEEDYPDYYENAEFAKFLEKMETNYPNHYRKFWGDPDAAENKGGKGGELVPKKGRWGMVPPKMASVASSSRFCYLALRDGTDALIPGRSLTKDDVEFEKECRIFEAGGTAPQLDAYVKDEVCDRYIEAKCHEIFDKHRIELKNKYWDIFKEEKSLRPVLSKAVKYRESFELPKEVFGLTSNHMRFDVKQLVCHLLGIAKQSEGKYAELVYLFFKPVCEEEELSAKMDEVFEELQQETDAIFQCKPIKEFCEEHKIRLRVIIQNEKVMGPLK